MTSSNRGCSVCNKKLWPIPRIERSYWFSLKRSKEQEWHSAIKYMDGGVVRERLGVRFNLRLNRTPDHDVKSIFGSCSIRRKHLRKRASCGILVMLKTLRDAEFFFLAVIFRKICWGTRAHALSKFDKLSFNVFILIVPTAKQLRLVTVPKNRTLARTEPLHVTFFEAGGCDAVFSDSTSCMTASICNFWKHFSRYGVAAAFRPYDCALWNTLPPDLPGVLLRLYRSRSESPNAHFRALAGSTGFVTRMSEILQPPSTEK